MSSRVRQQRRRLMALAECRGMWAAGASGLCCGAKRNNVLLPSILAHVRVARVQEQGFLQRPSFARV